MEFIWNDRGFCENPKIITYKCGKKYTMTISIAKTPNGKWANGLNFIGDNEGFGYGVYKERDDHDDQQSCFQEILLEAFCVIERKRNYKYDSLAKMLKDELDKIKAPVKPVFVQLSMF